MRPDSRLLARGAATLALLLCAASAAVLPQGNVPSGAVATPSSLPLLRARAFDATGSVKMFLSAGTVRLVGWDHDSIVVRGRVARGEHFYFSGGGRALKLGFLDHMGDEAPLPSALVVYVPRRSTVSVKSVSADISGSDVSGWFYSVSGAIHLSGASSSVEAEALGGDVTLDVSAPWIRARTGRGRLLVRGAPQDADLSTISGSLDIASPAIMRGRGASVSGDIRYAGAPPAGALFDFSNHSGSVDLLLPGAVSGLFDLSTITGDIENGLTQVRPVADARSRGRSLRLSLGGGGSRFTVRTFKGAIRLRTP